MKLTGPRHHTLRPAEHIRPADILGSASHVPDTPEVTAPVSFRPPKLPARQAPGGRRNRAPDRQRMGLEHEATGRRARPRLVIWQFAKPELRH
jgi:hypothetical protein